MAPPRRRFAKPLTTRRYLTLRHGRAVIRALADDGSCDPDKEPPLQPGYEHLHSFYAPGLTGGEHTITVTQDIQHQGQKPVLAQNKDAQKFSVLAPRFQLPDDAVYSVYPPQGSLASHDTLPHVVFNDPMLPWERIGSTITLPDSKSNRVPWLACFAFTPDELTVEDSQLQTIFEKTSLKGQTKQQQNKAVSVPMKDLPQIGNGMAVTPFSTIDQATKPNADVIFLPSGLFNALFASYDDDGSPDYSPTAKPDITRHRFLAHTREINTEGMADADRDEEHTRREFSVLFSNRTGPLVATDGNLPSPMIVHVVSLEGIEKFQPFPVTSGVKWVGMNSLYSWTYSCLPPDSLNVATTFHNLAQGLQMLSPNSDLKQLDNNSNPAAARLKRRLQDGYSVTRHRMPTGEETAAIMRGPFTPTLPPSLGWDLLSNSGTSLEILDKELGMMDITYSTAWSLGRTLALADKSYTIALTRARRQIINIASTSAQSSVLNASGTLFQSKEDLAAGFSSAIEVLLRLSHQQSVTNSSASDEAPRTFKQAGLKTPDLSYRADGVTHFIESALEKAAYEISKTSDPPPKWWKDKYNYDKPYDELNTPVFADWVVVLRFVCDLYHLINVPSHYLLTDQSHLPAESFRLFFVDHNWIDALVDGALSLGNHGGLEQEVPDDTKINVLDDPVRRAMKLAFNRYLTSENMSRYLPPVPRFGFYARSAVIAAFPDLKFECLPERNRWLAPMLLRHDIIDKDVMLGLFSDTAFQEGDSDQKRLQWLQFTVPAHQQYFSVGKDINTTGAKLLYRKMYTVEQPDDKEPNEPVAEVWWKRGDGGKGTRVNDGKNPADQRIRKPIFVWGSDSTNNDVRLLLVDKLTTDVYDTLIEDMKLKHPTWFTEKCATAAAAGIQLNCPAYQLKIGNLAAHSADFLKLRKVSPCLSFRKPKIQSIPNIARHGPKVVRSALPTYEERSALNGLKAYHNPPHFQRVYMATESENQSMEKRSSRHALTEEEQHSSADSGSSAGVLTPSQGSGASSPELVHYDEVNRPAPTDIHLPPGLLDDTVPVLNYSVHPSSDPEAKKEIKMLPGRQDIVFSIVYQSGGVNFQLQRMEITVPIRARDENSLSDTIPGWGPGASMVSNLRFNVRSIYSPQDQQLKLEILPRTHLGYVQMGSWVGEYKGDDPSNPRIDLFKRTELSVILHGVHVKMYDEPVPVRFKFQPYYLDIGHVDSTTVTIDLVKP